MKHFLITLCFVAILLLNISAEEVEEQKEMEHAVMVKDFGIDGIDKTVSLNLTHSLKPGSIIVVVAQTDQRGTIDICDKHYNNLIHIDTRLLQDRVILNSYLKKQWGSKNVQLKPPVTKGAQSVTTILYEEQGFRIFVNGKEFAFYEHRSANPPQHLIVFNNRIFKIIYLATTEVNGMIPKDCSKPKKPLNLNEQNI